MIKQPTPVKEVPNLKEKISGSKFFLMEFQGKVTWSHNPLLNQMNKKCLWLTVMLFDRSWSELWIPVLTDSKLFQFSKKFLRFVEWPTAVAVVGNVESFLLISSFNISQRDLESHMSWLYVQVWFFGQNRLYLCSTILIERKKNSYFGLHYFLSISVFDLDTVVTKKQEPKLSNLGLVLLGFEQKPHKCKQTDRYILG